MKRENDMEKNSIKLLDGRVIEGYPMRSTINEIVSEESAIAVNKTDYAKTLDKDGRRYYERLFTDNAFLFLANRERIMNDSRMFLTPIYVNNGLAYSGAFKTATLGGYIEWWINSPHSVIIDKDGKMSLIWFLSGSPLSGANSCSSVNEEGRTEIVSVSYFRELWPKFAEIVNIYQKPMSLYEAYSLSEVVDILKRETIKEFYDRSIAEFFENR
jgi:hypothetical protein